MCLIINVLLLCICLLLSFDHCNMVFFKNVTISSMLLLLVIRSAFKVYRYCTQYYFFSFQKNIAWTMCGYHLGSTTVNHGYNGCWICWNPKAHGLQTQEEVSVQIYCWTQSVELLPVLLSCSDDSDSDSNSGSWVMTDEPVITMIGVSKIWDWPTAIIVAPYGE